MFQKSTRIQSRLYCIVSLGDVLLLGMNE
jgi:hypothetical protein